MIDSNFVLQESLNRQQRNFNNFKKNLFGGNEILYINNKLYLTKGNPGQSEGVLFRDKYLENQVKCWVNERVGYDNLMLRYQKYDERLNDSSWPKHYAIRFVNASGKLAEGNNIFVFFPEAIGLSDSSKIDDYFGLEFIDNWISVFDELILPCMRAVFNIESQIELFRLIKPRLEQIIYLASIFHEIGHRVGIWKVSPSIDDRIRINKFHTDILGELSTDIILISTLHEYPEIMIFVFLQRLFWFGRFGFDLDSKHGKLNEDNDAWLGSYLWGKYIESKCISFDKNLFLSINIENLKKTHPLILNEINDLGDMLANHKYDQQDDLVRKWMKENVPYMNNKFVYFDDLKFIYEKCRHITEIPTAKFNDNTLSKCELRTMNVGDFNM